MNKYRRSRRFPRFFSILEEITQIRAILRQKPREGVGAEGGRKGGRGYPSISSYLLYPYGIELMRAENRTGVASDNRIPIRYTGLIKLQVAYLPKTWFRYPEYRLKTGNPVTQRQRIKRGFPLYQSYKPKKKIEFRSQLTAHCHSFPRITLQLQFCGNNYMVCARNSPPPSPPRTNVCPI